MLSIPVDLSKVIVEDEDDDSNGAPSVPPPKSKKGRGKGKTNDPMKGRFLPNVPEDLLYLMMRLPGKALHVGLLIWQQRRIEGGKPCAT
jgi:hypothetical protein